ncbi:MAG: hypothetical protein QXQ57_01505 [Sulfolobales archaeon]
MDPNGRSYSLEFNISIKDRGEFYVPGPPEWLVELEHLHEEEHRVAGTVGSLNLTIKSLEDRLRTVENEIKIIRSSMQGDLNRWIYASLGIAIIALAIGILGMLGFRRG